jgi:hypothetical protein
MASGSIWIRPKHAAVVIPLLESGGPKIAIKNRAGRSYDVVWQPGSIHYLGGDISLGLSGIGRVVFIFLLFKMQP